LRPTTLTIFEIPPKNWAKPESRRAKRKGGLGEGIFARLLSAPKARSGWEAARPCVSKEAKPAKIVSLIEKDFCARPLKEQEIFAGFACRRQAELRRSWAGSAPVRAQIAVQRKFERRSVIATKFYLLKRDKYSIKKLRRKKTQNFIFKAQG